MPPELPPKKPGYTRVEYESILNETAKARQIDFGDVIEWIPASQSITYIGYNIIDIADWLYVQKGL